MITTSHLVFLQMQKTGSTHTDRMLRENFDATYIAPKHARSDQIDPAGRLVAGGIRNPFDLYVSMWAFGCLGKGGPRNNQLREKKPNAIRKGKSTRLNMLPFELPEASRMAHFEAEKARDIAFWARLYADPDDAGAFREWLHLIHAPEHRFASMHDYGHCPWHGEIGLYTYLCSFLYVGNIEDLFPVETDGLGRFDYTRLSRVDQYIRMENIVEDLLKALRMAGHDVTPAIVDAITTADPTNASARSRDFMAFYDDASIELVKARDGKLAAMFGYEL